MDYIREELLRQRNAWAALLRSGQRGETETPAEQQAAGSRAVESEMAADRIYGLPAAEVEMTRVTPRGAGQARRRNTVDRRREAAAAEAAAVRWGSAAAGSVSDHAVVPLLRPERRQEQGAKELSRVIQRDSRRYDGGFVLY